jgi:serine/threonine protein kinase/WD40 repeat protein
MVQSQFPQFQGYKTLELIDSGGFGSVYKAVQEILGREVAIKVILPRYASQPEFIRRFEIEAQLVARLEHPHITPLIDYWRDPNGAYLVMRYLRGGSLSHKSKEGALEPDHILGILEQIVSALDFAHRNKVIHRDIKPGNILLDEDGNAYLVDFGIAKDLGAIDTNKQTGPDAIVGSLDYIAPEQARGEAVTARTDIYSLGVTLYELLTGEHPFKNSNAIERLYKHISDPLPEIFGLKDDYHDALNALIQKATAKDPAYRYPDVLALLLAFREAVQSGATTQDVKLGYDLTPREFDILALLAERLTNREIADSLIMSVDTVRWHLRNIYKKLRVRGRMEAVLKARQLGILVLSDRDDLLDLELDEAEAISLPEPENPYKGLRAFTMQDVHNFFGREKAVEGLLQRMCDKSHFKRFLAVVGPSGSGKSSLVKAGLIPAIWKGGLANSEKWFWIDFLPGTHPIEELEIALTRVVANQSENINEHLRRDERGLLRIANLILPKDDSELLVVIDQFEEVFTLLEDEQERQHFLNLLYVAVSDARSRVRVVVTLRADYYDRPLHYPEFGEMLRTRMETILPLTAAGLEKAMIAPAQAQHVSFESGLVAQIVSEMNYQAGALPLLQYALTELFDRRQGRTLTHAAYQQIGGAVGALANRADEIYESLSPEKQALTQQMFLRLVTLGEGAEDTRRRTLFTELLSLTKTPDVMEEIIDTFAAYRLLSLDRDEETRQPTVEVAHEAILRQWERLRQWLNESRDDIRQERILAHAAADWEVHKRDNSYLLRGARLENIEGWQKITELVLTPLEQEFITSSIQQREVEFEVEMERQAHEKALEKREIELIRQALIRTRVLVAVFVVAAILSGGFGIFAFEREGQAQAARATSEANLVRAEREAEVNHSLVLSNNAEDIYTEGDTELALLLAQEAMSITDPPIKIQETLREIGLGMGTRAVLQGHENPVKTLSVSPDGSLAISAACALLDGDGCHAGEMILWDLQTATEFYRFNGHNNIINIVLFSKDGLNVWSASSDGKIIEWDSNPASATFGKLLREFTATASAINDIAISPDGSRLVAGMGDGWTILMDTETGNIIQRFRYDSLGITSVAISPDAQQLLSGSQDGTILLWDITSAEIIQRFVGHINRISNLAFHPDAKRILSASDDFVLRLWDLSTGAELKKWQSSFYMNDFVIDADGRTALVDGGGGTMFLLTIDSWQVEQDLFNNVTGEGFISALNIGINTLAYWTAGNWSYGLAGLDNGDIVYWNLGMSREGEHFGLSDVSGGFLFLALSENGQRMLGSTISTGEAILWDIDPNSASYQSVLARLGGYQELVIPIALSADGHYAIIGSGDYFGESNRSSLKLWDVDESSPSFGTVIHELGGYEYFPRSAAFSSDSSKLLVGTQDLEGHGGLFLYEVSTGALLRRFNTGHDVSSIIINPDNKRAMEASAYYGDVVEWDIDPLSSSFGSEIRRIPHSDVSYALGWGPNANSFFLGSIGSAVLEYDYETGDLIRQFQGGHSVAIWSVELSPDVRYLVAGTEPGGLLLWDYQTGQLLWNTQQGAIVNSTLFAADSQSFYSVAIGYEPIQWQVTEPSLDELLAWIRENRYIRELSCEEHSLYRIEPLCEEEG